MAIDTEAIAQHVRGILEALGEDPQREGLLETPQRVATKKYLPAWHIPTMSWRRCLAKHLKHRQSQGWKVL